MFRKLIITLLFCLLTTSVFASQEYSLEPYDINVKKHIDVNGHFIIDYITVPTTKDCVRLQGTIKVSLQYKVQKLELDYYIQGSDQKRVRATNLKLTKGAYPNTYNFVYDYELDLFHYEYEKFGLFFIVEEIETNTL
jgi:hypothetical protein